MIQTTSKIVLGVICAIMLTGIAIMQPVSALAYSGPTTITSLTNTQRHLGTVYQNTQNTTMFVYVSATLTQAATYNELVGNVGNTNSPNISFGTCEGAPKASEAQPCTLLLIVPPNWYYEVIDQTNTHPSVLSWTEAN